MSLAGWAAVDQPHPPRPDGRRQHVPQPGPDREARRPPSITSRDGRAILGIGGAWFEREHDALGIDFGSGFGERLDRLDEAVGADAPAPRRRGVRPRGPLLHDARGVAPAAAGPGAPADPDRRLRARRRRFGPWRATATRWNTSGAARGRRRADPHPARALRGRRAATRPTIEMTISFPMRAARRPGAPPRPPSTAQMRHNGDARSADVPLLLGSPAARRRRASGPTASSGSERSSHGCPPRSTARRSTAWARSASPRWRAGGG